MISTPYLLKISTPSQLPHTIYIINPTYISKINHCVMCHGPEKQRKTIQSKSIYKISYVPVHFLSYSLKDTTCQVLVGEFSRTLWIFLHSSFMFSYVDKDQARFCLSVREFKFSCTK